MQRSLIVLSAVMSISATAASGQQLGQEIIDEQRLLNVTKGAADFSAVKWEAIKKDAPAAEVKAQLEQAGWETGVILKTLEGGTTFDLYQKALGPGQVGFMALPKSGSPTAEPATFLPTDPFAEVIVGGAPRPTSASFTTQQIQAELERGIQTGIDTFCGLRARPSTVTMTVSAFSFVEVEATWDTKDVCPATP